MNQYKVSFSQGYTLSLNLGSRLVPVALCKCTSSAGPSIALGRSSESWNQCGHLVFEAGSLLHDWAMAELALGLSVSF